MYILNCIQIRIVKQINNIQFIYQFDKGDIAGILLIKNEYQRLNVINIFI